MSNIFSRVGVRLEVAEDVLGAIIAHYAAEIGKELAKPNPDVSVIEAAERVQDEMDELRDSLSVQEPERLEEVIKKYGPIARELWGL